ncbi:LON peptidase substrate-binding domain-containing protein [Actinomycetospora endophytica]|uniref:LON peptidase substrate-binding domain-containing protein n=1 Tax=Actinomycetospora endophytica TaxID=2291215 RepID=A0ABS8PDR1_9PSEU|nr:LON peptidase substrate-binding domain-containing protein [Actinomycetospora endophytica]MCD2196418.1 LON peptidase substrate-binding domain-containing protein [Actinomycetospora endophytica]
MDRGERRDGGRVETLPLFPLGTVLLPGAPLPLHVFEPRYRQLTIDLVTGAVPGKQFGVVAVREGWGPDDGPEGLHEIGCTAALREVRRLPDGRFDMLTMGDRRFRLIDVDDSTAPYLVANVEWLPDVEGGDPEAIEPLERAARAAHRRYCTTARTYRRHADAAESILEEADEDDDETLEPDEEPALSAEAPPMGADDDEPVDASVLAHVLAADCLLPLGDRQELLEQTCPRKRLELVSHSMAREAELLGRLNAVWAPTAKFAVPSSDN